MLAMPQFQKMKPSAVLINTGRGELTNEDDLAVALKAGVIRTAQAVVNVLSGKWPEHH